jgi:diguanylate cyclase (GGDEF)-like protein
LGGDEFAILIPKSTEKIASFVFDRIQSNCNQLCIPSTGNIIISLSAGYASYPSNCDNEHDLLKIADDSLYKIKFSEKGHLGFA